MKQLTCEMCGSTELVKQDGYFVCQTCGTKYSVEEAKKMMIEGTVDVSGSTIKVDTTADTQNNILNARRAIQKEDWEEAERYYNLVERNDPSNIEAIFYSSYSKARSLMIESDHFKREHGLNVLCNCLSMIDANFGLDDIGMIGVISDRLLSLTQSSFVYKGIDESKLVDIYFAFINIHCTWMKSLCNIVERSPSEVEFFNLLVMKHFNEINRLNLYRRESRQQYQLDPDCYGLARKARVWLLNNSEYGARECEYCVTKEIRSVYDVHEVFVRLRDLANASYSKGIELLDDFLEKYPFAGLIFRDRTFVDKYNDFRTAYTDEQMTGNGTQKLILFSVWHKGMSVKSELQHGYIEYLDIDIIMAVQTNMVAIIRPAYVAPHNPRMVLHFAAHEYSEALKLFKAIGAYARFLGNNKCEINLNPNSPPKTNVSSSGGGCYVATCVYGSYDCPEVWTLRRYRDDTLGSTWCGRLFIRTYYAISPTIVKWFGNTNWFKRLWKGKLDRMVDNLQAKGVASTPYEDKKW